MEDRLRTTAEPQIHGHCNVPMSTANTKLAVGSQTRTQYRFQLEGKQRDHIPNPGIGQLRFQMGAFHWDRDGGESLPTVPK
jgi:hypothetical protein